MATKPTPGASDGTYGTELNAHLDVSLDVNGKIKTEALQTDSTAPVADAAVTNKLYVDSLVNLRARLYLNSDQLISTGVDTIIQFTSVTHDRDSITTIGASAKIIPAVEGYYIVIAQTKIINLANVKAGILKLFKNTVSIFEFAILSAGIQNYTILVSDVIFLGSDDFVQVKIFHNHGSSLNISGTSQDTFLTLQKIGK